MAYPRFQRARQFKYASLKTASPTASGTYAAFSTTFNLPLQAQAGDVIECWLSGLSNNQAGTINFDVVTLVSAAPVSYASTTGSAGSGVGGWTAPGNIGFVPVTGSVMLTLAEGDIVAGVVTVSLYWKVSSGSATMVQSSTAATQFGARNLGPLDAT